MNISKIGFNAPGFGSIKKSAAEKAIKMANGDVSELRQTQRLVEEQKNNHRYDIEALKPGEYYNFIVIKRGENSGMCFMNLHEASGFASRANNADVVKEKYEEEKAQKKPEFDRLASEILGECEE